MNIEDFNSVVDEDDYSHVIDRVLSGDFSDIGNSTVEEQAEPEKETSKPSKEKRGSSSKKKEILDILSGFDSQMIDSHVMLTKRQAVTLSVISSVSQITVGELIRKAIDSYYARYMEGYDKHSDFIKFYTFDKK